MRDWRIFRVIAPAIMVNGLHEYVPPPISTFSRLERLGVTALISMTSARPAMAPTGMPPPRILPRVVRSGVTPTYSWAPPKASRNPVMTSSKMSTAPRLVVSSRRKLR